MTDEEFKELLKEKIPFSKHIPIEHIIQEDADKLTEEQILYLLEKRSYIDIRVSLESYFQEIYEKYKLLLQ